MKGYEDDTEWYIDDREIWLEDTIIDENTNDPCDIVMYDVFQDQLREVLNTLHKREQDVIKMRFGLEDGYALTLEEVGVEFDVMRERIRQIEAKALRRLRHPKRATILKPYRRLISPKGGVFPHKGY